MDIDVMQKEIARLKAFERDARPMLAEWQAHKAEQRLHAAKHEAYLTSAESDERAATILAHARTISRLVAPHAHAAAR